MDALQQLRDAGVVTDDNEAAAKAALGLTEDAGADYNPEDDIAILQDAESSPEDTATAMERLKANGFQYSETAYLVGSKVVLAPTFDNIGTLLQMAQDEVDKRVDVLKAAFMAAFEIACDHGNSQLIYFDDAAYASCFQEPEDVAAVRQALQENLQELFEPHGKTIWLRTDKQYDIGTPYQGERYTFIATISDDVADDDDEDEPEVETPVFSSVRLSGVSVDAEAGEEIIVEIDGGDISIEKVET